MSFPSCPDWNWTAPNNSVSLVGPQVKTQCLQVGQVWSIPPTANTKPPSPSPLHICWSHRWVSSMSSLGPTNWKRFNNLFEGMRELQKHGIAGQRKKETQQSEPGTWLLTLKVQSLPRKRGPSKHMRTLDGIWKDYTPKVRALETDQPSWWLKISFKISILSWINVIRNC